MKPTDIIQAKRDGYELSFDTIENWIHSYVRKAVPDYQMSAWLMAVFLKGMTPKEIAALTSAMVTSGEVLDLGKHYEHSADKHSTGGVGDKTSLVVLPIAAACGVKVAKMSGRGLGHTGGTVDKLESISGFRTALEKEEFLRQLDDLGVVLSGQTADLAPADKLMYALRDVTATVESVPLIASSIMSKKIAAGAKNIVLDVKYGQGAFMKTAEQAIGLAKSMVDIGQHLNRQVVAYVTDMNNPLGFAIGNALEVKEAVDTLQGKGPDDLLSVSVTLASEMVHLAMDLDIDQARSEVMSVLCSGKALEYFRKFIEYQGGMWDSVQNMPVLPTAPVILPVSATKTGYMSGIDALAVGRLVMGLGAGREKKEDEVDMRSGIVFERTVGSYVKAGEPLAYIHARSEAEAEAAANDLEEALMWNEDDPLLKRLIYARVTANKMEVYD